MARGGTPVLAERAHPLQAGADLGLLEGARAARVKRAEKGSYPLFPSTTFGPHHADLEHGAGREIEDAVIAAPAILMVKNDIEPIVFALRHALP